MPIHYGLTKRKLFVLDRLTARLSYCVRFFSEFIYAQNVDTSDYHTFPRRDVTRIARLTNLSSGYVQQCRDQALWMWRRMRRMLQQRFPYGRRIRYIIEECVKRGVQAELILEAWTSRRCHRCGSTNSGRPSQSFFRCLSCGLQYNADWNSAIYIGSVFLPVALNRRAIEGLAYAGDELAHKSGSPEVGDSIGDSPMRSPIAS